MLYNGEVVGNGAVPACDIAVDPIDGTSLTAAGRRNAISMIAAADRGSMLDASTVFYMEKLVAGPDLIGRRRHPAPDRRESASDRGDRASRSRAPVAACSIGRGTTISSTTSEPPVRVPACCATEMSRAASARRARMAASTSVPAPAAVPKEWRRRARSKRSAV